MTAQNAQSFQRPLRCYLNLQIGEPFYDPLIVVPSLGILWLRFIYIYIYICYVHRIYVQYRNYLFSKNNKILQKCFCENCKVKFYCDLDKMMTCYNAPTRRNILVVYLFVYFLCIIYEYLQKNKSIISNLFMRHHKTNDILTAVFHSLKISIIVKKLNHRKSNM